MSANIHNGTGGIHPNPLSGEVDISIGPTKATDPLDTDINHIAQISIGTADHDATTKLADHKFTISGGGDPQRKLTISGTGGQTKLAISGSADQPLASVQIGEPTPVTTQEISAKLTQGFKLMVRNEHYYDPISKQMLTMNFGTEVARKDYEACTRALVGTALTRMSSFLEAKGGSKGLGVSLEDIKSYQFDWKKGVIHMQFKSGVTYSLAAGEMLRDAIRPYLVDASALEKLPEPASISNGLRAISPRLPNHHEAFVNILAFDQSTISRLEIAVQNLKKTVKEDDSTLMGYRTLLNVLHGIRHGMQVSITDEEYRALSSLIDSKLGWWESRFNTNKLTESGNPWLQTALERFYDEMQMYATFKEQNQRVTLNLNGKFCVQLGEFLSEKEVGKDSAHLPRHINLNILNKPTNCDPDNPIAKTDFAALYLEPQLNIAKDKTPPIWAKLTSVTCHVGGEVGDSSKDAQYIHFALYENQWWRIADGQTEVVPWSTVQRMASFSACHLGLDIDPVVTASPNPKAPMLGISTMPTAEGPVPAQALVLDEGMTFPSGYKALEWHTDEAMDHREALEALYNNHAQNLTDNDNRDINLWKQYIPVLLPKLSETRALDQIEKLSPEAQDKVRAFFDKAKQELATVGGLQRDQHYLASALSYGDVQKLADLTHKKIVIHNGRDEPQGQIFIPEGESPDASLEELHFASFHLSENDPSARSILTPLVSIHEIQAQAIAVADTAKISGEAACVRKFLELRAAQPEDLRASYKIQLNINDKGEMGYSLFIGNDEIYCCNVINDSKAQKFIHAAKISLNIEEEMFKIEQSNRNQNKPLTFSVEGFIETNIQCMTDNTEMQGALLKNAGGILDDSSFSRANFVEFRQSATPDQTFIAVFKNGKELEFSNRPPSNGEFRGNKLQEALQNGSYNNLRELLTQDYLTEKDSGLVYLVNAIKHDPDNCLLDSDYNVNISLIRDLQSELVQFPIGKTTLDKLLLGS